MAIFMPLGKNPLKILTQIHFCIVSWGQAVKSYTIIIARDSSHSGFGRNFGLGIPQPKKT